MMIHTHNFGLNGLALNSSYDDGYDNLFKGLKDRRADKRQQKQDDKDEKRQRKEDRRGERQEKREANNDKRRLKNDMKQAQIEEKRAQTNMMTQAGAAPGAGTPPPMASDNTTMIVAGVVVVLAIAGIGYAMMHKKPVAAPLIYTKAA